MTGGPRAALAALLTIVTTLVLGTAAQVPARAADPAGWTPPELLAGQATGSEAVLVDSRLVSHRAWVVSQPGGYSLLAAHRPPGGHWTSPVTLQTSTTALSGLEWAEGSSGSATLVWVQRVTSYDDDVWAATRRDGAWGLPERINTATDGWASPRLASNAAGDVVVAWVQAGTPLARFAPAGQGWAPPALLAWSSTSSDVQVGLDDSGRATFAWEQRDNAGGRVLTCEAMVGATSCGPATAVGPVGWDTRPYLAVGGAGHRVLAIRVKPTHDTTARVVTTSGPSAGWGGLTTLDQVDYPMYPVMDRSGVATLTLHHSGRVQLVRSRAGGPWQVAYELGSTQSFIDTTTIDPATGRVALSVLHLPENGTLGHVVVTEGPDGWSSHRLPEASSGLGWTQVAVRDGYSAIVTSDWAQSGYRSYARSGDARPPVVSSLIASNGYIDQSLPFSVQATDWLPTEVSWEFGDGARATGHRVNHTYRAGGSYAGRVTVTDLAGNTTTRTWTSHITRDGVAPPEPSPSPTPSPSPSPAPTTAPPTVSGFRLEPARIRATGRRARRTRAVLTVSTAARVRLVIRRAGRRKPVARLVRDLPAGTGRIGFTSRVGGKRLRPGRYVVTALATDPNGTSKPVRARLRVVR